MIQKATDTYSCIDTDILNMIQELFLKTIRNDKGDPYGSYEEIMCVEWGLKQVVFCYKIRITINELILFCYIVNLGFNYCIMNGVSHMPEEIFKAINDSILLGFSFITFWLTIAVKYRFTPSQIDTICKA